MLEIAVDIGGTFTDIVCLKDQKTLYATKVPSTPHDLTIGVREGTVKVLDLARGQPGQVSRFVHGTTIATNAVLEHKGAVMGLLMTAGFEDTLEIGRLKRSKMYDLFLDPSTPTFLAPGRRRKGINERIDAQGNILTPLDENQVRQVVRALVDEYDVQAIAVCYMLSFRNPAHERRTREIILEEYPDLSVSISSEVDPVFLEYERTCVTAFDAYVHPNVVTYLEQLQVALSRVGIKVGLHVMQSRGAVTSVRTVTQKPVTMLLSGPAAGVMGGVYAAEQSDFRNTITVDIGGTSCDVSLVKEGQPSISREGKIMTYPLRVPMVNVNAIGAGGGSIAWLDAAGGLRVGPQSAGADPGPACYGQGGEEPTVTDASLVLGYLNPEYFAAGEMKLNMELAHQAIQKVAQPLGLDVTKAAYGIHQILNARMADEIRLVSVRQGHDPRQFSLVALGGAGSVHCGAFMRDLEIPTLIVPPSPGVLSAFGLLTSNIEHEQTHTYGVRIDRVDIGEMSRLFAQLEAVGQEKMAQDDVPLNEVQVYRFVDTRYVGQAYELEVPVPANLNTENLLAVEQAFHDKHHQIYGHSSTEEKVEFMNLRTIHTYALPKPEFKNSTTKTSLDDARKGKRSTYFVQHQDYVDTPLFERTKLPVGAYLQGPAIIEQPDTTVVVYPGQMCRVDEVGNLIIQHEASQDGN